MTEHKEEVELDLLELGVKLWSKKKFILKVSLIGAIIGIIIGFSIPKEYTTKVILTPESQSGGSGTMGSLAALAGINLGSISSGTDALATPDLYPDVVNSTPFIRNLLQIRVIDSSKNIDTTLYSYMLNYQESAWWNTVMKAPSKLIGFLRSEEKELIIGGNSHRVISKEEMAIIKDLQNRLSIASEKKTGLTTIDLTMQSPEIVPYLSDTITAHLQSYIIDYRTQKAKNDLLYAEKLFEEAQSNYYKSQSDLAAFRDANMNVVSAKYKTNEERLQNEANLAYSVYNQTAQQLQITKIKVQDTTPVFTVIQPAIQPLIPSKPSKKLTVIAFVFLSFIGASAWVLKDELFGALIKSEK